MTQQVQPAHTSRNHEYHEQRGRQRPGRNERRQRGRRNGALLLGALWLLAGLWGAFSYGHDYNTYRGFPPPSIPKGVIPGKLLKEHFYSTALAGRRQYLVYLPPGYARAVRHGVRFPVLYLLHGSPGAPRLFVDAGGVTTDMSVLVAHHAMRPYLIVMPDGHNGTFRSDTEWADTPSGRYESYVLDVVRNTDARFATLRDRGARAIAGNSEGAYAAINIALRRLPTFSIAESWSGYYVQKPKGPFARASAAQVAANSPVAYLPRLRAALARHPLHAFVYIGRHEREHGKAHAFASQLRAAGADSTFASFKGGHNWRLWRRETPRMLVYAARRFQWGVPQ
jgi:enterochelin esterase-like enzyme